MLGLTIGAIVIAIAFYILRVLFKKTEFDVMSIIMSVVALALVLQDPEIVDNDLILFIVPIFYTVLMSGISLMKGDEK